ncbi:MAG: hypothetical protein QOE70_1315 [Chthoniobacter sp.]|jgi:hypothetical protein|nr:hypothetical protein [Chthoniobacter sp.]
MTGAGARKIWKTAAEPVHRMAGHAYFTGQQRDLIRLEAGIEVLRDLKVVLQDAVTTGEDGALGEMAADLRDLHESLLATPLRKDAKQAA